MFSLRGFGGVVGASFIVLDNELGLGVLIHGIGQSPSGLSVYVDGPRRRSLGILPRFSFVAVLGAFGLTGSPQALNFGAQTFDTLLHEDDLPFQVCRPLRWLVLRRFTQQTFKKQ
jgi:hypothetical protein